MPLGIRHVLEGRRADGQKIEPPDSTKGQTQLNKIK